MQMLIDFLPLLLALVAYQMEGIYAATIVLMVTLPLIPIGQYLLGKKVSQVHVWSAALVLVFGAATLFFRNPGFIMWKPTVLYLAMAAVFMVFQYTSDKTIIERMLGGSLSLLAADWRRLNVIWSAFFVLLAILNIYVAYSYEEATWFKFKVWGLTGLTLVFVIAQSIWMAPRILEPSDDVDSGDK